MSRWVAIPVVEKPLEITPGHQNPNVYMHKNPKKFPFKKKKKKYNTFIYLFIFLGIAPLNMHLDEFIFFSLFIFYCAKEEFKI